MWNKSEWSKEFDAGLLMLDALRHQFAGSSSGFSRQGLNPGRQSSIVLNQNQRWLLIYIIGPLEIWTCTPLDLKCTLCCWIRFALMVWSNCFCNSCSRFSSGVFSLAVLLGLLFSCTSPSGEPSSIASCICKGSCERNACFLVMTAPNPSLIALLPLTWASPFKQWPVSSTEAFTSSMLWNTL